MLRGLTQLEGAHLHVSMGFAMAAVASMVISGLMAAWTCQQLLVALHRRVHWPWVVGSLWVSLLGRYIPGKAATVAGAVWLLSRRGVPAGLATSAILMRTGTNLVSGLLIALPLTLWQPVRAKLPGAWLWCVLLAAAGIVLLHPRVFSAALSFAFRKLRRPPLPRMPGGRHYLASLASNLLAWLFLGLGCYLGARSVCEVPIQWVPVFVAATSLATVLGLLAVFAPGGLGVREGILTVVLAPVLGVGLAGAVALLLRVLVSITDILLAAAGALLLRSRSNSHLEQGQPDDSLPSRDDTSAAVAGKVIPPAETGRPNFSNRRGG